MVNYIHQNIDPSLRDDSTSDETIIQDPYNDTLSFTDWRGNNVHRTDGYDMIWMLVQNDIFFADCNWTIYTPEENCAYVGSYVQALNDTKRIGGIFTTVQEWTAIMGNQTACQNISSLPLWFGGEDTSSDAANYDQIGGWDVGAMKQFIT